MELHPHCCLIFLEAVTYTIDVFEELQLFLYLKKLQLQLQRFTAAFGLNKKKNNEEECFTITNLFSELQEEV